MLRAYLDAHVGVTVSKRLYALGDKIKGVVDKTKKINLLSEDLLYKIQIEKNLKPTLYENHIKYNLKSCAFCTHLVKTHCHAHCLKCASGTYIHCSPLLPGLMYYDKKNPDEESSLSVPWLYKKTCDKFTRLDLKSYFRNFAVPFSWITVYNYEVFEGLHSGLSSKERPCFVCASIDYCIYRDCMDREDFDKNTPCPKISILIESIYRSENYKGIGQKAI